mmetsp:Transcript_19837/g.50454  ORF Transcript_19837/g.50454 Transcript_19837/m.50454 type:complete len:199 (-) Transcript_19837:263-859(-)
MGDPRALFHLGTFTARVASGADHVHDAFRYFDELARRGYAFAILRRAEEEWKRGFAASGTLSAKRAADLGLAQAHMAIGDCFANGEHGFPRSVAHALPWYRQAAERGDDTAWVKMGACYYNGTGGINQDFTEAANCYRVAAERGNAQGMFFLGECLGQGLGVSRDEDECQHWLRSAASLGHQPASTLLKQQRCVKPAT